MSKDNTKFSLSMYLAASTLACFSPFLVNYLSSINYTNTEITSFLLIYNLGIVLSFPFIGFLNDNYISIKKTILILITICLSTIIVYLYSNNTTTPVVYTLLLLFSFFQKPLFPLMETYLTKISQKFEHIDFGIPRSFASLGYAITCLALGFLIEQYGFSIMFTSLISFFILLFLSVIFLKDNPEDKKFKNKNNEKVKKHSNTNSNFVTASLALLKNYPYLFIIATATFMTVTLTGFNTYLPVYVNAVGGNTENLGIALFIMAISEIPVLVAYKKLNKKYDENYLLLLACFVNIFKMLIPAFFHNMYAVYFAQGLQSITFGLFIPSIYIIIRKTVHPDRLSYGISIATTIYSSIFGTLSVFLSGVFLDNYTIFTLLKVYAIFSVIAFATTLLKIKIYK